MSGRFCTLIIICQTFFAQRHWTTHRHNARFLQSAAALLRSHPFCFVILPSPNHMLSVGIGLVHKADDLWPLHGWSAPASYLPVERYLFSFPSSRLGAGIGCDFSFLPSFLSWKELQMLVPWSVISCHKSGAHLHYCCILTIRFFCCCTGIWVLSRLYCCSPRSCWTISWRAIPCLLYCLVRRVHGKQQVPHC